MMSNDDVYAAGLLNRALNPATHPPDIQAFLRAEIDFLHEVIAEGTPESCQRHRPPHLGHLPADVRRTSGLTSGRTDPSAGLRTPTRWAMRPSCRSRRRFRAAIDRVLRKRPGIGRAPLFPSPDDMTKPVSKYLADKWLRKAEDLAEIPNQEGSLWHAYWRKWATERKDLLDVGRGRGLEDNRHPQPGLPASGSPDNSRSRPAPGEAARDRSVRPLPTGTVTGSLLIDSLPTVVLQTVAPHNNPMVEAAGIEPATFCLQSRRSPN